MHNGSLSVVGMQCLLCWYVVDVYQDGTYQQGLVLVGSTY
jgi:hypothetical protein